MAMRFCQNKPLKRVDQWEVLILDLPQFDKTPVLSIGEVPQFFCVPNGILTVGPSSSVALEI